MNTIPRPEHPRPDFMRDNFCNLNGEWHFQLFEAGEDEAERVFDRESYSSTIQVPFSWGAPLSGVGKDAPGTGWYMREVEYPCAERLFLVIGACDYDATVYVNGVEAARHKGGYTPIEVDVTSFWRAEGKNRIEVRARDLQEKTQMYGKQGYGNALGIWQTVYLEARPKGYISEFRFVTEITGKVCLRAQTVCADGQTLVARFGGKTFSAPVANGAAEIQMRFGEPRLWSPDDPYLYEGALSLTGGDQVRTYFGIREISTGYVDGRKYRWILLNGKPLYVNATLDQAFHPKGFFTSPSDEDLRMEAWRLKRLGLNAARIHIKCEEPRKLYWMDKLGVLIIADVPNFWGDPCEEAVRGYEDAWPVYFARDYNHPSIFMWVMFNETWGLFTHYADGRREYAKETQDWVRDVYLRAKAFDPTRLVEDNSACNWDHVETDINTWHFYKHGYETVKNHVREVVDQTYPGSAFNYVSGCAQTDAPLMNSECGMVWGVEKSAGDSDIAWQYHYMLNEFRLHDKLCGFVFTEFHDVVNEFNGYYRIDDTDKDFGYDAFCPGMQIRDLHANEFVALDCPPCAVVNARDCVTVPAALSCYSNAHWAEGLSLRWTLWHDTVDGRVTDDTGVVSIRSFGWGVNKLEPLNVRMPEENALAILSLCLCDAEGSILSRNFTTFRVRAPRPANAYEIPLESAACEGFSPVWKAQAGNKLCMGGAGRASFRVKLPARELPARARIALEAGAKRVLTKDLGETGAGNADLSFMLGYRVDRGAFQNSYWMTDETRFPSNLVVRVNGEAVYRRTLSNDPADARGVLSWLYQGEAKVLDEAGSYGELLVFEIPSRLIPAAWDAGEFTLTFEADGGLALYGGESGRYPIGLTLIVD